MKSGSLIFYACEIMRKMVNILLITFFMLGACSEGDNPTPEPPEQGKQIEITLNPEPGEFSGDGETKSVIVTANADWTVTSGQPWCMLSVTKGYPGQTSLQITVLKVHSHDFLIGLQNLYLLPTMLLLKRLP